jgi:hypothetical protein
MATAGTLPTSLAQQQPFMLRPSQQTSMVPSSSGQFFSGSIVPGFYPQMNLNPAAMALFAQAAATAFPQIPSGSQLTQQQQLRRPTTVAAGGANQNAQQTLPPATIIPPGGGTQTMLPPPIGISNTTTTGVRFYYH